MIWDLKSKSLKEFLEAKMTDEKDKPIHKIRVGAVSLDIWKNVIKTKDGREFNKLSASIEKNYKVGDEWKTANSYDTNELLRLKMAVNKALSYMLTNDKE